MNKEQHKQLEPHVKVVAKTLANSWPGILEASDIEQQLWQFLLESPSALNYCLNNASATEVKAALRRKGEWLCSQERLAYDRFTGNWYYTVSEVRTLLQLVREGQPIPDVERIDLTDSLNRLCEIDPDKHDLVGQWVAGEAPNTTGAERQRLSKAFEKLTDLMNTNHHKTQPPREAWEGLGSRPSTQDRKNVQV